MKSLLLENGINIQFGGKAYSSDFIMKRIKYRAKLGAYEQTFGNALTGEELIYILDSFVTIANDIRNHSYDIYVSDADTLYALNDFKKRYTTNLQFSHEIMLEDWFFILHMFFLKEKDLQNNAISATQGFERLVLDAIYNGGKIQELYLKIPKKAKKFFKSFDNIFTLNYDNNAENLTQKKVYHLHGDFSVLANSENPDNVQGYIRTQENNTVVIEDMKHCFCNALLNYSGKLKYKVAQDCHNAILATQDYHHRYHHDSTFRLELSQLQNRDPLNYKLIMTKILHPELNMSTEYYFDKFKTIQDELFIIGLSPNNDGHIFDLILNNKYLHKVYFYYFSDDEKKYIENHYPADLFECRSVQELWKTLDSLPKKYNINYSISPNDNALVECCNIFSDDNTTIEQISKELSQIPSFEIDRLCQLVKIDMNLRNPNHQPTDENEFIKSMSSISYIALQEGLLPSTLYFICIKNFKKLKD